MIIERAGIEDAKEILDLQKLAFKSEAEIYDDYTISPLTQTLEEIETDFENQVFLKASADGKIIGSVRAYIKLDTCFIGRLIVHPDFQNQSIGTKLMHEIEKHFSKTKRFEIFTGYRSMKNIYLYQKLGYRIFKNVPITKDLKFLHMEKCP
ncbi:MAG: GNAT family N-acetyltransferase [Deltaproteobacteria bacterium]|nr:MAG: GNAT family N-acetyltransferase [Deltaproteobacteria bacterium]